jgi:hypothetical protein
LKTFTLVNAHTYSETPTLGRAAAAIILQITYGIQIDEQVDEDGDNYVSLADKAMSKLARAGLFGTYMVVNF